MRKILLAAALLCGFTSGANASYQNEGDLRLHVYAFTNAAACNVAPIEDIVENFKAAVAIARKQGVPEQVIDSATSKEQTGRIFKAANKDACFDAKFRYDGHAKDIASSRKIGVLSNEKVEYAKMRLQGFYSLYIRVAMGGCRYNTAEEVNAPIDAREAAWQYAHTRGLSYDEIRIIANSTPPVSGSCEGALSQMGMLKELFTKLAS